MYLFRMFRIRIYLKCLEYHNVPKINKNKHENTFILFFEVKPSLSISSNVVIFILSSIDSHFFHIFHRLMFETFLFDENDENDQSNNSAKYYNDFVCSHWCWGWWSCWPGRCGCYVVTCHLDVSFVEKLNVVAEFFVVSFYS